MQQLIVEIQFIILVCLAPSFFWQPTVIVDAAHLEFKATTAPRKLATLKPAPYTALAIKPVIATKTATQDLLSAAGIPRSDWVYVDYIISAESGWRYDAWNNEGSGSYGLCQALPASKMSSAGADYLSNPVTQLKWCDSYAKDRYGGWYHAYQAWLVQHWW